jgi:hypothetical protein
MRLFEDKLGRDKPIKFVLGYRDMKIKIITSTVPGAYDPLDDCFTFDFTLELYAFYDFDDPQHMHMNLPKTELLYDEIPFKVTGNMHMMFHKIFMHLNRWEIRLEHGTKHYPHRNNMNMTTTDYLEFLGQFKNELRKDKPILNNILKDGVMNPWRIPEFNTYTVSNMGSIFLMFAQREYTEQE